MIKGITLRDFQAELLSKIQKNSFLILPTGSGKTVIGFFYAERYFSKGKKVLFLCPTLALVNQQKHFFEKHVSIPVGILDADASSFQQVHIINHSVIVCATPFLVRNMVERKEINLNLFELIVFDEAHKATKKHAYNIVRKSYFNDLLALSASPANLKALMFDLRLEHKFSCENPEKQDTEIEAIYLDLPQDTLDFLEEFKEYRKKTLNFLKLYRINVEYRLISILGRLQQNYPGSKGFIIKSSLYKLIQIYQVEKYLSTQSLELCLSYLNRTKLSIKKEYIEKLEKLNPTNPKLNKIEELINSYRQKAIIFCNYRECCELVYDFLKKRFKNVYVLKGSKDKASKEKQQQYLENFRKDSEMSILISTSTGEEGLDIPSVNLIICYEPVSSHLRYVQRIGRTGRHQAGKVVILINKNSFDEVYHRAALINANKMNKQLYEDS